MQMISGQVLPHALIEWVERMIAKSAVLKTELHSDYLELKSRQR